MKKTTTVFVLFVAAVLAGLFLRYSMVPAPALVEESVEKETFMQREVGMPLDTEAVDGPVGVQGYSGTPPLLGSQARSVPLKPYDMANDQELFQFDGNRVSSDCCPSPFSTDRGCICLTDAQIQEFSSRGGNRA